MKSKFGPENAYEVLVQSVVDYAIYLLDREGRVSSWNPGAERIKGYSPDEILGEHFSRFYTEEDRHAGVPEAALVTAAESGRYGAEGWRVRKDGSRFWALVAIDAVRNDKGEVIGFAKVTRDISDRREAQLRELESERRFRLLVQGVSEYAIYMLDPDGRVTNWNAGAARIKGYAAEEIVGEHFSRFYAPEDFEAGLPSKALETARRDGRFEAEGWRVRKDGSRFWASVVIDAIHDDHGQLLGFAKITRDMTERREAQQRLEEAREQLFQSKMDALGQLTGGLAHDFNNLLTAILGAADIGGRHLGDPDKLRRMFSGIETSARRGADLTKQLLAFARRQPLELKLIELAVQLPLFAERIGPTLGGDIQFETAFDGDLWPIETDPSQLEQTLMRLVANAQDAMPEGGRLRFAARNARLAGEVQGLAGEFVAISIEDTGAGIPTEIRPRIFEPFFTTKQFGHGTGLGLAQVYGFAQQSKGAVAVESAEGRGTTMTLYLPSRGAAAAERADRAAAAKPGVLVVEDEPFLAELAADLVREFGYEPYVAHSAAEALSMLTRISGVKLVFTDVIMPGGMSGLELARKVRTRYPELPIVLTTGYSQVVGSAPEEFPLLPKPYDVRQLEETLRSLVKPVSHDLGSGIGPADRTLGSPEQRSDGLSRRS